MDSLLSLMTGHPFIALLLAIAAVVFILSLLRFLLRSLFKLAVPVALVAVILVVFFGFSSNNMLTKGKQLASDSSSYALNTIKPIIDNLLKNAHVK